LLVDAGETFICRNRRITQYRQKNKLPSSIGPLWLRLGCQAAAALDPFQ
jgi:hypothetical protein